MKLRLLPRRLTLLLFLASGAFTISTTQVQAQGIPAEQANANAFQLMNDGKLAEAAGAFEDVVKKYPTSTFVSDAQFRLAYLQFLLGDYEKSRATIDKILAPPAPSDISELGYALIPQILAAKASKEKDDGARKAGFEASIKEFDAFVAKYPQSLQVESIVYGRALSCFQIAKYDDAIVSLRSNLKNYAQSETILESQFLLALGLMSQGGVLAQATAGAVNAEANVKFDESERLLNEIITKRSDIALINDAQFQLGELLTNRAIFAPKEAREPMFAKALAAYRALLPKEITVDAQQTRIKNLRDRRLAALTSRNLPEVKRIDTLLEHEVAKLETVKGKGDLSVSAQIKVGQLFFHKDQYDESRVVFSQMLPFAEDEEQKKNLLYYLSLSYAQQSYALPAEARPPLVKKAVDRYDEFQKDYKGDSLADALPFTIGRLFLAQDPETAIKYFQEEFAIYPKSRVINQTLLNQADACLQLKQFDKARGTYESLLKENPTGDLAVASEFGIANIVKETGKIDEAIPLYKKVMATYPGTPQAENSSYWVGQLYLQKKDFPAAVAALVEFLKTAPKGDLVSVAKYGLAQAYSGNKDTENALRTFKEIADEFPKSQAAPFTYFERSTILTAAGKTDERNALLKEFIERYPDDDKLYYAYAPIAQDQVIKGHVLDAIATYTDMVDKHPNDPQTPAALLAVVTLWTQQANAQGRYFTMSEESQRTAWKKCMDNSMAAAEKLITNYPDCPQVASAAQSLLGSQKMLSTAKIKTDEEVTKYFQDLAAKFEEKPQTKSKILFTLASFTYENDKAKAVVQMTAAYNPKLIYAPADIDLYGSALLEQGKGDDATKVYQKLAQDFPNPANVAPEKAPQLVQQAQSISMYGLARATQLQGNVAEAAAKFETFKKLYPSAAPAKMMEANYGIALAANAEKKYDTAIPLLIQVYRVPSAGVDLRAKAMLLHAQIMEAKGETLPAMEAYNKIAIFYDSVPAIASESIWCAGKLLEKQAATLQPSQDPKAPTKAGQLKKAVASYKELVAKYPNSPHVNEAKARLAVLEPGK